MSKDMKSLSLFERKEYEELKNANSEAVQWKKDRSVFVGFFVIALIGTLMITGVMAS